MTDESRIAALHEKFGIPTVAKISAGNGGLPRIQISTAACSGEIYLHGAQVTSWRPSGMSEVIFVSEKAQWQAGKAIRGGIPVCFPWFRAKRDDPAAPQHGFVRLKEWQIDSIASGDDDCVSVRLSTASDEDSRKWWPFDFRLEYAIAIGKSLTLELRMMNTGHQDLTFEEALHTYFRIGDVQRAIVRGLAGLTFLDNRDENHEKSQEGDLRISKETDNAYRNAAGSIAIIDGATARRLTTKKHGSSSTVVWNPWIEGAGRMADFGGDEWRSMLCVEGANILDSAVRLSPGESHEMRIEIHAEASGSMPE